MGRAWLFSRLRLVVVSAAITHRECWSLDVCRPGDRLSKKSNVKPASVRMCQLGEDSNAQDKDVPSGTRRHRYQLWACY